VDVVAGEALGGGEPGIRCANAGDDFVLLASQALELGLLFDEMDEEFADERRNGAVLLSPGAPRRELASSAIS